MDPYLATYLVGLVITPFIAVAAWGFPDDGIIGLMFGAIVWPISLPAILGDMIFEWRKGKRK